MSEIVTMQYYIVLLVILVILSKTQKPEESIFKTNMSILVKISSKSTFFFVVFAAETSKNEKHIFQIFLF